MTKLALLLAAIMVFIATAVACSSVTEPISNCSRITLSYEGATWEAEESVCRNTNGTVIYKDDGSRYCCK